MRIYGMDFGYDTSGFRCEMSGCHRAAITWNIIVTHKHNRVRYWFCEYHLPVHVETDNLPTLDLLPIP